MAASKTQIANFALSHIGEGKAISDLDSENSREAKVCRQFYELARDTALRDFPWAFAQARKDLELIKRLSDDDPNTEWTYAYQYPSDALMLHRIESGVRRENRQSRVPFEVLNNGSSRQIWTDCQNARLVYTKKIVIVEAYPDDFVMALSYKLASLICPLITAHDPFNIKRNMMDLYAMELDRARANDGNEPQPEEEPRSEFDRARGYFFDEEHEIYRRR